MWSDGDGTGRLQAARFGMGQDAQPFHRAVAAPGLEQFAQNTTGGQGDLARTDLPHTKQRIAWPNVPGFVAALPQPQWRTGVKP
jgi:hypothetical protein